MYSCWRLYLSCCFSRRFILISTLGQEVGNGFLKGSYQKQIIYFNRCHHALYATASELLLPKVYNFKTKLLVFFNIFITDSTPSQYVSGGIFRNWTKILHIYRGVKAARYLSKKVSACHWSNSNRLAKREHNTVIWPIF